ncbi:GntR family transcriptional regulator [Actinoplanes couchii]|uniref:GntR family transcriptional regulator n=1 Tax=Actinoplanes couchii TaxID=403638 RepID=A0ABQ3XDJ0_9ACTN|nr:GntR family transcriptional regulator [Actinoplanes couchii]MDR6317059.1 GntR family transcriptional regulator [Actinoplanes couchii]GID56554.1 GntR family transcriptional regulator [Actinoplanes couchii]
MKNIERASPVPYYVQLYEALLSSIQSGELPAGQKLPGESELHRTFALSRPTVRQALDMLESNGYAQKVARRGYFVAEPDAPQGWHIEGLGGFLENGLLHGDPSVTTTVVSSGEQRLPDEVTTALRIPRKSIGFVLERVRSVDGQPALFSTNWTPPGVAGVVAVATGVREGTSSLTAALQSGGYQAAGARRVMHAVAAGPVIAAHLRIPDTTPMLRIRSTTWDKSLVPYDYYETWLRTDIVPLAVDARVMT